MKYILVIIIAISMSGCGQVLNNTSDIGESEQINKRNYHNEYYTSIENIETVEDFEVWFNSNIVLVPDNYPDLLDAREPVYMYTLGYGDLEDKRVCRAKVLHEVITENILIVNER